MCVQVGEMIIWNVGISDFNWRLRNSWRIEIQARLNEHDKVKLEKKSDRSVEYRGNRVRDNS